MPYKTRKRLKLVRAVPPVFRIDLNDDEAWNHYHYFLDTGIRYVIRGIVKLLTDKDDKVIRYVDKEYEFLIPHLPAYYSYKQDNTQEVVYNRQLELPDELVNDFKLSAGMGIELVLNEFMTQKDWLNPDPNQEIEVVKIFPEVLVSGSMDFELKGLSGEPLPSSELLIISKFSDTFYVDLVSEINDVFRIGKFTATMVLIRKLFENLLVDLLRERFILDPSKITLFFDPKKHEYRGFITLKDNLKDNLTEFEPYDPSIGDKDFRRFLEEIKEKGDECAHNPEILLDPNEINRLKPSINKYSDLLIRLTQKIREKQTTGITS